MNGMNKKDLTIARELKKRLAEVVDVVNLIVFGSRARGDADEYSDDEIRNSPLRASPFLNNIAEEGVKL
jgi:predicted nucleotidyltransferase